MLQFKGFKKLLVIVQKMQSVTHDTREYIYLLCDYSSSEFH